MENKAIAKLMVTWAKEAKARVDAGLDQDLGVQEKTSSRDLVTVLDGELERFYRQEIKKHFPNDRILGEEGQGDQAQSLEGAVWIVDPIDGTLNFVKQRAHYVTMLARYVDGIGQVGLIYGLDTGQSLLALAKEGAYLNGQALDLSRQSELAEASLDQVLMSTEALPLDGDLELYQLSKSTLGLRIFGCAGLDVVHLALGRTGLYLNQLYPWDNAVALILADLCGFKVTDFKGQPLNLLDRQYVLMAYPKIHQQVLNYLRSRT
ncbi:MULTISPECIES: inositol monophosphatase family protein [Aerococcus]|uniref:Inositol monophosphatase family protein n=1 Tax=Aerococcus loyolae TaxID=2976809 RepID=A0ABT4BXF8_9LACT|nr:MULTISPECIES: inositol monophosphatase family protein [Aerococcus]KAA9220782.1 inositol monophosphatase family protein [Aerococcus loyolae]KAA9265730.1 inositol monophosphatase family protein [Aerococcus loyolae]MCY3024954.1 inositol monophosphatase family protein [Aerococcus loyolae]MCY3026990.1 inositol monophosphatase family protein [Aerococcus loyolae]MCY3028574.1 inositol monophosphatase family protein [Aerococcus loyolae]